MHEIASALAGNFGGVAQEVAAAAGDLDQLDAKRLQLLHEFVPKATTIGVLIDPNNSAIQPNLADMDAAANVNGQRLVILNVSTEAELKLVFASLQSQHIDALLVTTNPIYEGRRQQLVALAERYSVPVLYPWREYSVVGGLISYSASFTDTYRQVGSYVGRILNGEKPGDLPVQRSSKVELIINMKTARSLGITFPLTLLGRADEVIE